MEPISTPVAFITGASRGIGRAVAEGLAQDGWSLALVARDESALLALRLTLPSSGPQRHIAFPLDVSHHEAVEAAVRHTETNLGPIRLGFNNAAINTRGTLELSPEEFEHILKVNVQGVWNVCRAIAGPFKARGSGYLMNVSSVSGKSGFAGAGAYCATKFAVLGLSEALFNELLPLGIKVTALCPSWTDTEMAQYAPFPGKQMIALKDIFSTVRYLLSLSPTACPKELVINCREDAGG